MQEKSKPQAELSCGSSGVHERGRDEGGIQRANEVPSTVVVVVAVCGVECVQASPAYKKFILICSPKEKGEEKEKEEEDTEHFNNKCEG